MNKIIITIGTLIGLSCQPDGTRVELAIDHIGDMQEWVIEDLNNGSMDSTIADYYLHHLSKTEELLTEFAK
jgi:hypothetical protein